MEIGIQRATRDPRTLKTPDQAVGGQESTGGVFFGPPLVEANPGGSRLVGDPAAAGQFEASTHSPTKSAPTRAFTGGPLPDLRQEPQKKAPQGLLPFRQ